MTEQKCLYCQGRLALRRGNRLQPYGNRWILIENLPAWVCTQCGERYYTPQVHDYVVNLLRCNSSPQRTEVVKVYDAIQVTTEIPV